MKNFKRLFSYLKGRYRYLVISLIMVLLIQVLGFISPLLVKAVLDDCILGIEYNWVEVESVDEKTVVYNNKYYKQERYLDSDDNTIGFASVVLYKDGFYFANDRVENGSKEINIDTLIVTKADKTSFTYKVSKLTKEEVVLFYNPIVRILIVLIVLLFIKNVLVIISSYIQQMCTAKVINLIARDGRSNAMKNVESLPIKVFEEEPAGKTANRITTDVDGFIILYRQLINLFTSATLSFIFAYVGMIYLDYRLALLSLVVYPFVYIWVRIFLKKLKRYAVKVNESRSMLTAKINEIINGINILQVFNFKDQTIKEFNEINQSYKDEQLKEVKLHLIGGWNLINVLRGIVIVAVVWFFGWQHLTVSGIVISAGLIYAYNEYLGKIIAPISIIFTQVSEFQHSHVRIDRISKLIEEKGEDTTKYLIPRFQGDVKFDDVWFSYVDNEYVLKGVSFEIEKGKMLGLVGHTGSGKSSLMNLLLRFYDITDAKSGKIYVDGIDISTIPKRCYREHIGIVLQDPVLFKGTIASNIRFGKNDITDKEIEEVLVSIGAKKLLSKLPKGINQEITRAGSNMSSGEKQIISLARAIVHNPAILIMDEATSHIDTETEEMIKKALNILCEGRTVIVIAHRLSTIFNADKIIVLDHGLKVEEGTHESLIKANGLYANIYRAQVENTNLLKEN